MGFRDSIKNFEIFPAEVKCLLHQLLCGVAHMHDNWILHRDLKTSNLLLSHKGILKVQGFERKVLKIKTGFSRSPILAWLVNMVLR